MSLVWTTAFGLAFWAGTAEPRFAGFVGHYGHLPPVPAHMAPIDHFAVEDWWFVSGTIEHGPYVSLLALDAAACPTVWVRFTGEPEHSVWPCWHPCDADGSGWLDSRDVSAFLSQWIRPAPLPGLIEPGDWNLDGPVNSTDISDFLTAWLEGL